MEHKTDGERMAVMETPKPEQTWNLLSYVAYAEALRTADEKFQEERDRRYTEVSIEKEKALKIKEIADLAALELARDSQKYKDERSDALREQTLGTQGAYVTHVDLV